MQKLASPAWCWRDAPHDEYGKRPRINAMQAQNESFDIIREPTK